MSHHNHSRETLRRSGDGSPVCDCVIFVPFITAFGGVERLVVQLSQHLQREGIRHTVVTFSNSVDLNTIASGQVNIVELAGTRSFLAECLRLRKWLRRDLGEGADATPVLAFDLRGALYIAPSQVPFVLHLTDPPSLLPADVSKHAPSLSRSRAGRAPGPPADLRTKALGELTHRLNGIAVRRARRVIAMTNRIAAEITALYHVRPLVIRPGVSAPSGAPQSRGEGAGLRFLSISRLVESKRVDWILDSLAKLEKEEWLGSMSWELAIVGDGPVVRQLQSRAGRLGIGGHVRWRGSISEKQLEEEYARASIFLMPASQGWGLPAAEALARRVPVVLHEGSGIAEVLMNSPWAEITCANTADDFAAAVRTMVKRAGDPATSWGEPPSLPAESDWAARICEACSWISASGLSSVPGKPVRSPAIPPAESRP